MTPAKNLTLRRNIYVTGRRTFGELYVEGSDTPIAVTLEPEYNPAKATVSKSDTAIKAGRYRYTVQRHPKLKMILRYSDVPGRYGVLMHTGNKDDHTSACTMPGQSIVKSGSEPIAVQGSADALAKILKAITGTTDEKAQIGRTGWISIVDDAPKSFAP